MSAADETEHRTHLPPLYRSSSQPKPKGILKNAPNSQGNQSHSLQWDEENLALTEVQKDSLMKITEPKTPYVRYNAETDEFEGEIPNLDIGRSYAASPPPQSPEPLSPTNADTSGPSSRRTSFSSNGRPSGRSASSSSSRSTSFSLPNDSKKDVGGSRGSVGEEVEMEEEEMDEETQKKHAEFLKARGRHYSNEAEAMKRARELMKKEETEEEIPNKNGDESLEQGCEDIEEEAVGDDEIPGEQKPPQTEKPAVNGV